MPDHRTERSYPRQHSNAMANLPYQTPEKFDKHGDIASEITSLVEDGMDPLVAATYYNQNFSVLRLPDELLLEIMKYLDPIDIQCLRRTSRVFLRLFGSTIFTSCHDFRYQYRAEPLRRQQPLLDHRARKSFLPLLERDRYCGPCLRVRRLNLPLPRSLAERQLYCGRCQIHHAAGLFSVSQRRLSETKTRICIAHEGYLRVCQHAVFRWSDIERWMAEVTRESTTPWMRKVLCNHHEHDLQCEKQPADSARIELTLSKWRRPSGGDALSFRITRSDKQCFSTIPTKISEVHQLLQRSSYDGVTQFILPEMWRGQSALIILFDPNRCSCSSTMVLMRLTGNCRHSRGSGFPAVQGQASITSSIRTADIVRRFFFYHEASFD